MLVRTEKHALTCINIRRAADGRLHGRAMIFDALSAGYAARGMRCSISLNVPHSVAGQISDCALP